MATRGYCCLPRLYEWLQDNHAIIVDLLIRMLINLVILISFSKWLQDNRVIFSDFVNDYKIIMRLL